MGQSTAELTLGKIYRQYPKYHSMTGPHAFDRNLILGLFQDPKALLAPYTKQVHTSLSLLSVECHLHGLQEQPAKIDEVVIVPFQNLSDSGEVRYTYASSGGGDYVCGVAWGGGGTFNCYRLSTEGVRHASRNADSACRFLYWRDGKKGHAESAFRDACCTSSVLLLCAKHVLSRFC